MHTIKPLDTEAVTQACKSQLILYPLEDFKFFVIGGLGSAISEFKSW